MMVSVIDKGSVQPDNSVFTAKVNNMDYHIIDSDRHVVEPMLLWKNYIDSDTKNKYPVTLAHDSYDQAAKRVTRLGRIEAGIELPSIFMFAGKSLMNHWNEELQIATAYDNAGSTLIRQACMSPQGQIDSMNGSNVNQASIFPTFAGYVVNHNDIPAEVSLAYATGYNLWLKDYCDVAPDRLNAVGLISRHEPENMVKQLEAIISFGWTSLTLRPEVIADRTLGHPDYEEFWQACEQNEIAVALHGGTHLHGTTAGSDRFTTRFSLHACSHPMEMQMAFVSLLESGVLERYPGLKIAFIEAGASWVPHWLWRLDNICYPEHPQLVADNIKMLPSEYFKRQCWVSIEMGEPSLHQTADLIGHDKLLYGSDFPHTDHLQFDTKGLVSSLVDFSEQERRDILQNNAIDFYFPAPGSDTKKTIAALDSRIEA